MFSVVLFHHHYLTFSPLLHYLPHSFSHPPTCTISLTLFLTLPPPLSPFLSLHSQHAITPHAATAISFPSFSHSLSRPLYSSPLVYSFNLSSPSLTLKPVFLLPPKYTLIVTGIRLNEKVHYIQLQNAQFFHMLYNIFPNNKKRHIITLKKIATFIMNDTSDTCSRNLHENSSNLHMNSSTLITNDNLIITHLI